MCDIYLDKCRVCFRDIPMHLGDYETHSGEIAVYCQDCFERLIRREKLVAPYVVWKCVWPEKPVVRVLGPGPDGVAVVSLTENAWTFRDYNHPNGGRLKKVKEAKPGGRSATSQEPTNKFVGL